MTELRRLNRLTHVTRWRAWHGRLIVWCASALTAVVVVGFAQMVDLAISLFDMLRRSNGFLALALTPAGAMLLAYLTRTWFAGTEGSGIPQVIAALKLSDRALERSALVSWRIAVGKVILGTAALAVGFSSGREGPSVQVGASLMYGVRRLLPRRFPLHPHHLLLAGGAAGLAAAFNTPLAGIVFAIEELGRRFEERTNGVLLTAIILAGTISISLLGNYTYFGRIVVSRVDSHLLLPVLLVGITSGVVGGLFSRLMLIGSAPWPGSLGRWKSHHPVIFAGMCGLLITFLGYISDGAAHGSGYLATRAALEGRTSLSPFFAVEKLAATLLSYLTGVPGGIFAPSLAVGAGLGQNLASLGLAHAEGAAWMAFGMAGFLAGVTQAPITAFVIVMEMIDGHAMVVSLIAVAFLASLVSRLFSQPIYQALSQRYIARFQPTQAE